MQSNKDAVSKKENETKWCKKQESWNDSSTRTTHSIRHEVEKK